MLLSFLVEFDIQKAHGTYRLVLEGVDVGGLWSYVVKETRVPGRNHQPWTGNHSPATCRRHESNLGRSGEKQGVYPYFI